MCVYVCMYNNYYISIIIMVRCLYIVYQSSFQESSLDSNSVPGNFAFQDIRKHLYALIYSINYSYIIVLWYIIICYNYVYGI